MDTKKFPETIYVGHDENSDEKDYLFAYLWQKNAVDGDGPNYVAVYKLIAVKRLRKKVVVT